jgi:hypothetical protein
MLLHLVRTRELLLADDAGKDLASGTLVIEEGVPLEAVLVLEVLADLHALALDAAVRAVGGEGSVAEKVQPADRHLGH